MSNLLRPIASAFGLLLVCCCAAAAQQAANSTSPSPAGGVDFRPTTQFVPQALPPMPSAVAPAQTGELPARRIEEARPSVFYLPDKRGELQPVLDFKYQDFVELYNLKNRLQRRDEPPKYSLQRVDAAGVAGKQYAELTIRVEVLVRDDDWVRIPLRLDESLLRGPAKYKGDGTLFLHYESDGDNYVCWLRGKVDSRHEVTLNVLVPLLSTGDETRLKLFLPRAADAQLKLSVPLAKAVGQVSEGATLLSTEETKIGTTDFNVVRAGGDFHLAWRKADLQTVEAPPVLEASAVVRARLDARSITWDATLQVKSYGSAFDHFSLRLPAGATLRPGNSPAYVITPLEIAGNGRSESSIKVQLPKKTTGPIEVHLAYRREYDPTKTDSWCELAGLEVIGAVRQWGTVMVSADGQWQTFWGSSGNVRPAEPLQPYARSENIVAAFEYSAQPYSLTARLRPHKTRVRVQPEYSVYVERDEMRLESKLAYTIHGPMVSTLEVAIPGWQLDDVGPDDIVSTDGVVVKDSLVTVPLNRPTSGTVELRLRAHRAIAAGAKTLNITLPQPKSDVALPLLLAVVAADNVELTPDGSTIRGLLRERGAPSNESQRTQQQPLLYRGTGGAVVFASGLQLRRPPIAANVSGQAARGNRREEIDDRQASTTIDRAWVQTRLTSQDRQDRAVFRFTTKLNEIEVILPSDALVDGSTATVDGKRIDGRTSGGPRLLIPLAGPADRQAHLLEVQYHFANRPRRGGNAIELPRIAGAWARRVYWQLILPGNEHLIGNPSGFTSEFKWAWQGCVLGREPLLGEHDLEAWTGAMSQPAVPQQDNVYLFSTIGSPSVAEIRTAARSWIVLWASGAALLGGLVLIYVPRSRHPATLLVLCIALVAAGFVAPEATLLTAQAASLGIAMTLVTGLLEHRLLRRRRPAVVRAESPSRRVEIASARTPLPQPQNVALTESMPAVTPPSPGNGEQ